jgi:hypothetical protein
MRPGAEPMLGIGGRENTGQVGVVTEPGIGEFALQSESWISDLVRGV